MKKYFVLIVLVVGIFLAKSAKAVWTDDISVFPGEWKRTKLNSTSYDPVREPCDFSSSGYCLAENYEYNVRHNGYKRFFLTYGEEYTFLYKIESGSNLGVTLYFYEGRQNMEQFDGNYYYDFPTITLSGTSSILYRFVFQCKSLNQAEYKIINTQTNQITIATSSSSDYCNGEGEKVFHYIRATDNNRDSLISDLDIYSNINTDDFDSVEIINLDESGDVKVGLESPFKAYNKTCIIGDDCFLDVGYGYQSIGKSLQFRHAEDDSLISTTTLLDLPILKTKLEVPAESFSAKFYYCLSIDFGYVNPTWTGVIKDCTYSVKWVTQEYFDENIAPGFAEFDINSACDSVATSSGEMWDDFRFGFECGFRKLIYWATVPSPQTYFKIEAAKENLMTSFPFTYYRQVQRIVYNSTTATSSPVSVNMGTFIHDDFMPDMNDKILFSAEIIKGPLSDKWDLIQNTMKYLVYVALGMYLINRLISMSSSEKV